MADGMRLVRIKAEKRGHKAVLAWAALAGLLLTGCGQDCAEAARMGQFEFSQGNYANAVRHFERAMAIDSACAPLVKEKLAEARARL